MKRFTKKVILGALLAVIWVAQASAKETALKEGHNNATCERLSFYLNPPWFIKGPSAKSNSNAGRELIKLINSAVNTIDFAIYGLRNQEEFCEALVRARSRGVRIRGIVDMDIHNRNYYEDTDILLAKLPNIRSDYENDLKALAQKKFPQPVKPYWPIPEGYYGPPQCVGYSLKNGKAVIAVHLSRESLSFEGNIMHNKFFIIDGQTVWTGSTNVSDTGTGGYNANVACVINDKKIARFYAREFSQMYESNKFHLEKKSFVELENREIDLDANTKIACYFSPQDNVVERALLPLIRKAKKNINVAVFYLTHKKITAELIKAHNRGVDVRVIIDATSAVNGYTKHELLRVAGIPVKVENWGGKMHMKLATFDDEYVFLGSMNWTSAGERANDENSLVIHNKYYLIQINNFFDEMWNSIPVMFLKKDPPSESRLSVNSLEDGIDNDYDGLIDSKDDPDPIIDPLPPFKVVPKQAGYRLIKGIINKNGHKIYILPNDKYYSRYKVDRVGEGWFPSIYEAREAGFEKFNYKRHILNQKIK